MAPRVKIKFSLKTLEKKIIKRFQKKVKPGLKKAILKRIASGSSPVAGEGKFEPYSESYEKAIKRGWVGHGKKIKPVNMKVTGKMLKSLTIRDVKKGISIIFTDPKARYHDEDGAGASETIRRLLPGDGEKFYQPIHKKIKEAMDDALKRIKNK